MIAGEAAALHRPRACTALTRDEVNASLTSRLASLLVTVHALFVHLFATLNDHLRSVHGVYFVYLLMKVAINGNIDDH
eukprot:scaffold4489_cov26-Tisochrysis_lutea.AAC.3